MLPKNGQNGSFLHLSKLFNNNNNNNNNSLFQTLVHIHNKT